MRLLCLAFPRLGIQLARRRNADLAGRPVLTAIGEGDEALVSAASVEASTAGVATGMLATVARGLCPAAIVLPDNAADCLDLLERAASILRIRATPIVAVAGRDHLFLDLEGVTGLSGDEATAAERLAGVIRAWTGCDVRAGVASSRDGALQAARSARRFALVLTADGSAGETRLCPARQDSLRASFAWGTPPGAVAVRARLLRLAAGLQPVLEGRHESFREIRLLVHRAGVDPLEVRVRAPEPLHRTADAIPLFAGVLPEGCLDCVASIEVTFARLGPDVRVQPLRRERRMGAILDAPVRTAQPRLLRAG